MTMNRSKIEWTDFTWNPITGCTRGCKYCYARVMAHRLKAMGVPAYQMPDSFKPTFHIDRLNQPLLRKKPVKIFTCSMGEMFDVLVEEDWRFSILGVMHQADWHTFQVLTKQPYYLWRYNFPPNVWLGVSVTTPEDLHFINYLGGSNARVKFVSFEPLLEEISRNQLKVRLEGIDWIIIGAKTGRKPFKPPMEWIAHITSVAVKLDIPVFLKNNLGLRKPRQEYPKVKSR